MVQTPLLSQRPLMQTIPAQGNGRRLFRRKSEILAVLEDVIDAGVSTGKYVQGRYVSALEKRIEEQWGVGAAIAANSGSAALRLAFEVLDIPAGQEVIVPALTFVSTAYAVSDADLIPVFVDVDPQTLTIDPAAVQAAISEKTAAIVPVHLHGQMADMLPLLNLAECSGLFMVEDAAQAHGATYSFGGHPKDGTWYAGSMGDLGCFSMNGVKNMGALGDAGMVTVSARQVTSNPRIVERLRGLRDLGRMSQARYVHDEWGWRARMDEFSAAECLLELRELDSWNALRHEIAARYDAALTGARLQAPVVAPGRGHVYFNYAVQSPSVALREQFEAFLKRAGIEVMEPYTLVPDQKVYWTGQLPCRVEALEVARQVAGRITHVPLYPELEEEEIERIVAVLNQTALLS